MTRTKSVLTINVVFCSLLGSALIPSSWAALATRASEAHLITPFEKFGGVDSWADECERLREVKLAALAALEQDGVG